MGKIKKKIHQVWKPSTLDRELVKPMSISWADLAVEI
jgi:hypothetical protein